MIIWILHAMWYKRCTYNILSHAEKTESYVDTVQDRLQSLYKGQGCLTEAEMTTSKDLFSSCDDDVATFENGQR